MKEIEEPADDRLHWVNRALSAESKVIYLKDSMEQIFELVAKEEAISARGSLAIGKIIGKAFEALYHNLPE